VIEDLDSRFDYHAPDADRGRKHENIRNVLKSAAFYLTSHLSDSRETSLAITKMEEAMMWANAAVARHG
jgi:hypothetical protein